MYNDTLDYFAEIAKIKAAWLRKKPAAFAIASMMAGAYVGLGVILIFSVAGSIEPPFQKLVMGLSFGIALTLVCVCRIRIVYWAYHVYDHRFNL